MALIVVDAGILVAALSRDDAHHITAGEQLRRLVAEQVDVVVPATAYAEALVHPFRSGAEAVARVDALVRAVGGRIEPMSESIARGAAQLRAVHPRLRLPDAAVLATGRALRSPVLTTDEGWPPTPGIQVAVLGS